MILGRKAKVFRNRRRVTQEGDTGIPKNDWLPKWDVKPAPKGPSHNEEHRSRRRRPRHTTPPHCVGTFIASFSVVKAMIVRCEMETLSRVITKFAFLAIIIGCATVSHAFGKTVYVSPSGNDNNPGTSSQPVASPQKAVDLSASGDTIYFRAGRYTVSRFIWVGVPNLTISSYPGEQAAIESGTADTAGNATSVFILAANNVTLSDLEIKGGSYYGIKTDPDAAVSVTGIVIRRCYVHHTGRDCFKTFNSDNLLIEECEIGPSGVRDSSNAEGIDSIGSVGVIIRRNYIHDTATTGVYIKGGVRDGVVERNRIVNAGHSGILLGQDTDSEYMRDGTQYEAINCVARNNVIMNTGGAGVGTFSGNGVRFENNTLVNVAKTYNAGFSIVMNSRDIPARDVTFKNNVIVMTNTTRPMAQVISNVSALPLTSDSNIWYRPDGAAYKFMHEVWPDTGYYWNDLASWQTGMNADRNSRTVDPLLNAGDMYKPASGSPAIDRGEALAGVSADYAGTPRPQGSSYDIGAFEQAGSGTPAPAPNQPPTVSVSASVTSGLAPLAVSFTGTASDPDGQIASYSWSFGDGQTSTQQSPAHTYSAAGSFTARLTVTDNAGATANASIVINVTSAPAPTPNQPPTVSLNATPVSGVLPLNVRFTATAGDSDGQVVSYAWDFGNGQTSSQQNPSFTYESAGTFTARVTVTDNVGATASATVTINVTSGTGVTTQNVVWKNVVGAVAESNSLRKTAGDSWGNSGASSTQTITSGAGYVQFTATETNLERMCGLSNSDPDQNYTSIAYAIHLNTGRAFYVFEKGEAKGYFGDYNTGDVFKVAVEGSAVKYYRNGSVFYTSTVAPTYPLMADTALNGTSSTIMNAVISAGSVTTPPPIPDPTAPVVTVIKPNGGESFKGGSRQDITWTVTGTGIWRQDIQLSTDGGKTWRDVVQMLPGNATTYSWTVPNMKARASRIRVIAYGTGDLTGKDASDANFSITKRK